MASRKREEARNDLAAIWSFLAVESVPLADRFLSAVESALADLDVMPFLGIAPDRDDDAMRNLRLWRVRGFENYVLFYRPTEDGVELIRVVHGSRDIVAMLNQPGKLPPLNEPSALYRVDAA